MLTHGIGSLSPLCLRSVGFRRATASPGPGGARPAGSRNFLRPPGPTEVYTAGNPPLIDPQSGRVEADFHRLMTGLASRIGRRDPDTFWAESLVDGLPTWENPCIPSGYTYLLQLIAHDVADSVTTIAVGTNGRAEPHVRNARTAPLMLDALYGAGPDECPHAYAVDPNFDGDDGLVPRTRLRVGALKESPRPTQTTYCLFSDIARAPAPAREDGRDPPRQHETLIADPRNDAHAVLSQLTVLFHSLHNTVLADIQKRLATDPAVRGARDSAATQLGIQQSYLDFLCARAIVTLIYRTIIREDLLRRILHPDVYRAYRDDASLQLDERTTVPLEFSHGAFRFGHAMVREGYRINGPDELSTKTGLNLSARRHPDRMPPNMSWAVDWALFFDVGNGSPNLSRRIGPDYTSVLLDKRSFQPGTPLDGDGGLADRDFLSAGYAGLWSVPKLCTELRARLAAKNLIGLVPDYAAWTDSLRIWLDDSGTMTRADLGRILDDPPLPFFVLLEAAHDLRDGVPVPALSDGTRRRIPGRGGRHLGPLGSIIVAETMFAALRSRPFGIDEMSMPLKAQIELVLQALGADAGMSRRLTTLDQRMGIDQVDTVAKLLQWLKGAGAFG
jgi:hypothetical protein